MSNFDHFSVWKSENPLFRSENCRISIISSGKIQFSSQNNLKIIKILLFSRFFAYFTLNSIFSIWKSNFSVKIIRKSSNFQFFSRFFVIFCIFYPIFSIFSSKFWSFFIEFEPKNAIFHAKIYLKLIFQHKKHHEQKEDNPQCHKKVLTQPQKTEDIQIKKPLYASKMIL